MGLGEMLVSRYFFALAAAVIIALQTDRSGRTKEEMDERRGYTLVKNGEGESESSKERRYLYGIHSMQLPIVAIEAVILAALHYGLRDGLYYGVGLYSDAFVLASLYFMVLLLLNRPLRKSIRPMGCATLWLVPNALFLAYLVPRLRNVPRRVIPVPQSVLHWCGLVWLTGTVLYLGHAILSHIFFRRRILKDAYPCSDETILAQYQDLRKIYCGDRKKYKLFYSRELQYPLSIGLLPGKICVVLPEAAYSPEDLDLVFRHELIHICRSDAFVKLLLTFCTAVCWFNPVMHMAMKRCAEDLELSCDELVLQDVGPEAKQRYASLILGTAGESRGFTTCLSASAKSMKYRLSEILKAGAKQNTGAFFAGMCTFLLIVSLGWASLAVDAGTVADHLKGTSTESQDRIEVHMLRQNSQYSQTLIGEKCSDTEALLEYLSEIPCMELTKQYRLDWDKLDDNRFVQFYGNTSEGKILLRVGQNYMKLSVFQPYREKCYVLKNPLDMDYVLSLF